MVVVMEVVERGELHGGGDRYRVDEGSAAASSTPSVPRRIKDRRGGWRRRGGRSLAEAMVAFVPSAIITGRTQRRYSIVLTDVRALFVLNRLIRLPVLLGAMGGGWAAGLLVAVLVGVRSPVLILLSLAVGGFIAEGLAVSATHRGRPDYATSSPEELANRDGTLIVPYSSMPRLAIEPRGRFSHRLRLAYVDVGGGQREVSVLLLPEVEWLRSRVAAGVKGPAAYSEYAESV